MNECYGWIWITNKRKVVDCIQRYFDTEIEDIINSPKTDDTQQLKDKHSRVVGLFASKDIFKSAFNR